MNAFGPDWETGIPRVTAHEVDRVNKLKALGNSLVPQVALQIFQAIDAHDTADPRAGDDGDGQAR